MRRLLILASIATAGAFAACGLDMPGTGATPSPEGEAAARALDGGDILVDDGAAPIGESEAPVDTFDAGSAVVDASEPFDAGAPYDAGALPTDPGSPLVYIVSTRFWRFNPVTGGWAGGTQLPAGTCPYLDELAVDAFGQLYAIGNSGSRLYLVNPSTLSCTAIGPAASGYPQALTFAPRGTLNPYDEELVGYLSNGDYVRVDKKTGALALVKAAALSGYQIGDLANVGSKGYVALTQGSCGNNHCIWEVSLATGEKVGAAPLGNVPAGRRITGLAHWGGKLHAFCERDEVWTFDPANPGGATRRNGPPGYTNIAYRGAGSRTIAPTN